MKKNLITFAMTFVMTIAILVSYVCTEGTFISNAQGATYTPLTDVYYTKTSCSVYAEPTYTSTVLTTIGANIPVQVLGEYSNGWYRINIGVICYVKMDYLTTAGALGIDTTDVMTADAQKTAKEIGYQFVVLTLNKEKKIEKDVFNSYIGKKVILYVKINDELGVMFKMLYNDKVKKDISLDYSMYWGITATGERQVTFELQDKTELLGQIAIFQFKEGYDKIVDICPENLDAGGYEYMNSYWTEKSELAYAPVTQVANMVIYETDTQSLPTDTQRKTDSDHRKGIKYLSDDSKDYRSSIVSKVRKDTEYVDYEY